MARPDFDLVVIGGGSGGLTVAAGGAQLGAKVALVEKAKLGGDCLWYGCVPSKALLKSARVAAQMRDAGRWGLSNCEPRPDVARVMGHVRDVVRAIEPHDSPERFRSLGVEVIFGSAKFVASDAVAVEGRRLTARTFVIATGSRPAIPRLPGIDTTPYLTNETVFALNEAVPALIVVGAGPVGTELAQAFRRLGSDVTLIDTAPQILPREDADLAAVVAQRLAAEGVHTLLGASILGLEGREGDVRVTVRNAEGAARILAGTHLLLAAGRSPNVDALGLDAAGVHVEHGRIELVDGLRTTNPSVYVVGDASGGPLFTHIAEHHAGIVLRNALFRMRWVQPSPLVPWCTFTDPELARVGMSEAEAKRSGSSYEVYRFAFRDIDRAQAEGETDGFAKLVTGRRGRILGAGIVGAHAGELIAELTLAIAQRLRTRDLSAVIHTYPTFAQVSRRVADERLKAALTPTTKRRLQRIFGLRGVRA
jgi:pyruvate/2-oxoglutarate dehydrogenase complex dihydrolipoamide dehydrogenase (E3) component